MNSNIIPGWTPPSCYGTEKDNNNYFISFSKEEINEYVHFFKECGVVVIRDVISSEDCDNTINEIWKVLEKSSSGTVQRNNSSSWEHWPTTRTGMLGKSLAIDSMSWKNRLNPTIYQIFSSIYQDTDLVVSLDRYNALRPTRDIDFGDKILLDKPSWRSIENWFHFDMNPWNWSGLMDFSPRKGWNSNFLGIDNIMKFIIEGNEIPYSGPHSLKLQGLVALGDTPFQTGGFQCIPGFNRELLKQWAIKNIDLSESYRDECYVPLPESDNLLKYAQVIGMRKGSLLIWNSELPHCNKTNHSNLFRYCQYIKLLPKKDLIDIETRSKIISKIFSISRITDKNILASPLLCQTKKKSYKLCILALIIVITLLILYIFILQQTCK